MEITLNRNTPVSVQGGEPIESVIINDCRFIDIRQDSGFKIKYQFVELDTFEMTIMKNYWKSIQHEVRFDKPEGRNCNVLVFELTDYDIEGTITIDFDRM